MPTNIVEIPPTTPNRVPKVDIKCGEITVDIEFDIELSVGGTLPSHESASSSEFEHVGMIVRKMLPPDHSVENRIDRIETDETETEEEILSESNEIGMNFVLVQTPKLFVKVDDSTALDFQPEPNNAGEHRHVQFVPSSQITPSTGKEIRDTASASEIKVDSHKKTTTPAAQFLTIAVNRRSETEDIVSPKLKYPDQSLHLNEPVKPKTNIASVHVFTVVEKQIEPEIKIAAKETLQFVEEHLVSKLQQPQSTKSILASSGSYISISGTSHTPTNKILAQISTAISNTSKDSIEIRLDPPELGRVVITITQSESGLTAIVNSEKAEITNLLRRHSELLSREFSKSGFSETTLKFSHHDQPSNGHKDEKSQRAFSPGLQEQVETNSTIEIALQTLSGGLDIRL